MDNITFFNRLTLALFDNLDSAFPTPVDVDVKGRKIEAVVPLRQNEGSGFYVSPTTLNDRSVTDESEQSRYVNPLRIAAAVASRSLIAQGLSMGTFGFAFNV